MILTKKLGEKGMAVVKNIAELRALMMQKVREGMENTEDYVIEETKSTIDKVVYDKYEPDRYYRTFHLRDSIDTISRKSSARKYSMIIGHKTDDWFSIGEFVIDYVPKIVTEGKYGTYKGMGIDQFGELSYHDTTPKGSYSKPRPYMDETVKSLKDGNKYLKHLANNIDADVRVL